MTPDQGLPSAQAEAAAEAEQTAFNIRVSRLEFMGSSLAERELFTDDNELLDIFDEMHRDTPMQSLETISDTSRSISKALGPHILTPFDNGFTEALSESSNLIVNRGPIKTHILEALAKTMAERAKLERRGVDTEGIEGRYKGLRWVLGLDLKPPAQYSGILGNT